MRSHLVWECAYSWRWRTILTQLSIKGQQRAYSCGSAATQQGYVGRGWVVWELHSQAVVYKSPPPELEILSFDLLGLPLRWVEPLLYYVQYDLGLPLRCCPDCKAQALILLCGLILVSPWQISVECHLLCWPSVAQNKPCAVCLWVYECYSQV